MRKNAMIKAIVAETPEELARLINLFGDECEAKNIKCISTQTMFANNVFVAFVYYVS